MINFHTVVSFLVVVGLVSRIFKWYNIQNEVSFFDYVIWPKNYYNLSSFLHTFLNIISIAAYICVITEIIEYIF